MKIICIGRNFAEHAKEMKASLPTEPVFFLKPDTALLNDGQDFYYPEFTKDLHYECELVIRIDKIGKNIAEKFAHKYFSQFTLGIDFTARDLQGHAKLNGLPWEIGKAFDHSAAISNTYFHVSEVDLSTLSFELRKNGELVQVGKVEDMIFSPSKIISYISQFITLKTGDLIYTGTPSGVGPLRIGDILEGSINGVNVYKFQVR